MDLFLELLDLVEMLFQVHSLLLDHRHFAIISQDTLAGEFCIRDLTDELPFLQSLEEEGFLEIPGFVFELESFLSHRYLMRSDRVFARPSRPLCDALMCAGDRNIILYQA